MIKFFKKHYWVFLFLVVSISYGQLLWMLPWQDDNTLFFKLTHIKEAAGYFGTGPFGQGAYKYIATPYIPIYQFFGHQTIFYFAYAILFYFFASLAVTKTFSTVLGGKAGKLAGFLFAAGYVASDGFIRLFNTVSTSISVILISALLLFYWRFFESKAKQIKWYLLALAAYWAVVEVARIRTHYLVAIVFAFEIIFFGLKKSARNLAKFLVRLVPFLAIFYQYFLKAADSRSAAVGEYIGSLLHGDFSKLYSFLSAWANLVVPDWVVNASLGNIKLSLLYFLTLVGATLVAYLILAKKKKRLVFTLVFLAISLFWSLLVKTAFATPTLNLGPANFYPVFLGGEILLLLIPIFFALNYKTRSLFVLLVFWICAAIGSYAIYDPTLTFTTYHRYLIHAFFAWVGLAGLLAKKSRLVTFIVIVLGIVNLVRAVGYQHTIVLGRTQPVNKFYTDLVSQLPEIKKGDILYIDIADEMRGVFSDAFSVASMPEETAIAWRYGLDRYDFRLVTDYNTLKEMLAKGEFGDVNDQPIKINDLHTFFLAEGNLTETTKAFNNSLLEKGNKQLAFDARQDSDGTIVDFATGPNTLTPVDLVMRIRAKANYVTSNLLANNKVATEPKLRRLAFDYANYKKNFSNLATATATNFWRENIANHLIDGDRDTVWQAHRVAWEEDGPEGGAVVTLDLGQTEDINRLVWINAYANNTPTRYRIETSSDGTSWELAKEVSNTSRIDSNKLQTVEFTPRAARAVRFEISETLNNDTAGIAEMWVVPTKFSQLDLVAAEQFLAAPFGKIADPTEFTQTLLALGYKGAAQIYWETNKKNDLITADAMKLDVIYDGVARDYTITLPAGGTQLKSIKLVGSQVPGEIEVLKINQK